MFDFRLVAPRLRAEDEPAAPDAPATHRPVLTGPENPTGPGTLRDLFGDGRCVEQNAVASAAASRPPRNLVIRFPGYSTELTPGIGHIDFGVCTVYLSSTPRSSRITLAPRSLHITEIRRVPANRYGYGQPDHAYSDNYEYTIEGDDSITRVLCDSFANNLWHCLKPVGNLDGIGTVQFDEPLEPGAS